MFRYLRVAILGLWGLPSGTASVHINDWTSRLLDQKATAEMARAQWDSVLRNEADAYDMTYAYRRPNDGKTAWLRSRGLVRRDAKGTPIEMTGVVVDVTESTQQKDALDKSGRLAQTALRLLKAGTWDWNVAEAPDVTIMSPQAAAIIGYHSAEPYHLTAEQWRNSVMPVSPEYVAHNSVLLEKLRNREITGYDVKHRQIRADDGQVIWARVVANAVYDAKGCLMRVFGVTVDMTEQVNEEAALRKTQLITEQALEMSHSGTWWVNLRESHDYFYTTERTNAIFGDMGDSQWRVDIKGFMAQAHAGDPATATAAVAALHDVATGVADHFDLVHAYLKPHDNTVVWVHTLARLERDAQGAPAEIYGVVMDITERIHSERQMAQARETLEHALDLAKAATWSRSFQDGAKMICFSPRALQLLGFKERAGGLVSSAEMNRQVELAAGAQAAREHAQRFSDIFDGAATRFEVRYTIRREVDGQIMWVHDIGRIRRDAAGAILDMHGVLREVTEEHLAAQRIQQANYSLEQALGLARAGTWSWDYAAEPDTIQLSPRALHLMGFVDRPDGRVKRTEMARRKRSALADSANAELRHHIAEVLASDQTSMEIKYLHRREVDGAEV
jgi:PAS domain S-box-containing protein